jgi:uncharacterized protein (TIGR02246 family)
MSRTDVEKFAQRYAAAWCSGDPTQVAAHFSPVGSLTINDGAPAIGRAAITEAAQSFMTAIPDIQVFLDHLVFKGEGVEFHWTFTGTNTGPGGTGNRVRVSGLEDWQFDADGLILESQGQFDAAEYGRQLAHGVDETT